MSQDQNRKTLRHFQCRDYLWEVFEQMSRELECSTDYLINEAMRLYARSRNYQTRSGSQGPPPMGAPQPTGGGPGALPSIRQPGPPGPGPGAGYGGPPGTPGYGNGPSAGYGSGGYGGPPPGPPPYGSAPPGGAVPGGGVPQGMPPGVGMAPAGMPGAGMPGGGMPGGGMPGGAVPGGGVPQGGPPGGVPGSMPGPGVPGAGYPGSQYGYGGGPPMTGPGPGFAPAPSPNGPPGGPPRGMTGNRSSAPPPLPGHMAYGGGAMPPLSVIFNGQKIPIGKPEFVIGRGSKTADLPIKDGNISRRHAAVVFENGTFVMKDLGSTNGIEFGGQRIDNKAIQEGDVFQLCDYELRFTYH